MNAPSIDPATSLAFAIHAQPGIYAALIGSGVSRTADIPTGWEITEQLANELAAASGERIDTDPGEWYKRKFGRELRFSSLIRELTTQRSDRVALLTKFIHNGSDHIRKPTNAHHSLAQLAKHDWIKVFITTNFDDLLEVALNEAGVEHLVIYNNSQARSAKPFQHCNVVVFKLHGDYRNPDSILATEEDLSQYKTDTDRLLKKTLEDYGLVACGWSGEWDPALRSTVTAVRSRRYPMYITMHGDVADETMEMINSRDAVEVPIMDADSFFSDLSESIAAIESARRSHPLQQEALMARTIELITSGANSASLDNLLRGEVENVCQKLIDLDEKANTTTQINTEYFELFQRYVEVMMPIIASFAYGCAWSQPDSHEVWQRSLEQVRNRGNAHINSSVSPNIQTLPQVLLMYAGSTAAVNRNRFSLLKGLLVDTTVSNFRNTGYSMPLIGTIDQHDPLGHQSANAILNHIRQGGNQKYYTPASQLLFQVLHEPLKQVVTSEQDYIDTFDTTEVMLCLLAYDATRQFQAGNWGTNHGPRFGCFNWRRFGTRRDVQMKQEFDVQKDQWLPIAHGLFGQDIDRVESAFSDVESMANQMASHFW